tara:strand:+ start:13887 stop:14522 length:636 start_codon:yes stop_codon:yes gene_type:complete
MLITTKKEVTWVIIAILVMGFIISFSLTPTYSPKILLISAIIILTSVITKKIAGNHLAITVEHTILEFKQFWVTKRSHFKNPIPIGLIFPFFISIISLGMIKPFTLLQYNAENIKKKRIKRARGEGPYRREEINESDLGFTVAWSLWALILLTIIGLYLKQPELAKYSVYYALWNLIPAGQLDGMKLFMGSMFHWALLVLVNIIFLIIILI